MWFPIMFQHSEQYVVAGFSELDLFPINLLDSLEIVFHHLTNIDRIRC